MKRLIVCCDGTWQSLDNDWPTNVQRIAQYVKHTANQDVSQVVYYDAGVGSWGLVDKFAGGAFGRGLDIEIREAYRFLCINYEPGDEIFLFGFSRGAYTVRSLAGLIYSSGIVARTHIRDIPRAIELYRDREIEPSDDECVQFRFSKGTNRAHTPPPVTFIGCWDTVGALGVPDAIPFLPVDDWVGRKYEFHDLELGDHIVHARHAVAIDERRKIFDATLMEKSNRPPPGSTFKQVWFPGTHGCVGGGERDVRELSDLALWWMMMEASSGVAGDPHLPKLEFEWQLANAYLKMDATHPFDDRINVRHKVIGQAIHRDGPASVNDVSHAARDRWRITTGRNDEYRPETLSRVADPLDDLI